MTDRAAAWRAQAAMQVTVEWDGGRGGPVLVTDRDYLRLLAPLKGGSLEAYLASNFFDSSGLAANECVWLGYTVT